MNLGGCGSFNTTSCACTYSTLSFPGATATVVAQKVGNDFRFKPLVEGPGINLDDNGNAIIISGSSIFVNNTLYVDAEFGNDSTGAREMPSRPYATILQAFIDALPGDTIVVRPGAYSILSRIPLVNNVHFYFELGAIVNGPTNNYMFRAVDVTSRILGNGVFIGRVMEIFTDTLPGEIIFEAASVRVLTGFGFNIGGINNVVIRIASIVGVNNANLFFQGSSDETFTTTIILGKAQVDLGSITSGQCDGLSLTVGEVVASSDDSVFQSSGRALVLDVGQVLYIGDPLSTGNQTVFSLIAQGRSNMSVRVGSVRMTNGQFASCITNTGIVNYDNYGKLNIIAENIDVTDPRSTIFRASFGILNVNCPNINYNITNLGSFISNDSSRIFINGNITAPTPQTIPIFISGTALQETYISGNRVELYGTITPQGIFRVTATYLSVENLTINTGSTTYLTSDEFVLIGNLIINTGGSLYVNATRSQLPASVVTINGGFSRFDIKNLSVNGVALNILGNATVEFGGIWRSTGTLVTTSSISQLTLLPSKLVCGGANFITTSTPITLVVMPSSSNTPVGPSVTVVPLVAIFVSPLVA